MRARMGELYDAYTAAYGPIGRFTARTVTYHVKTLRRRSWTGSTSARRTCPTPR